MKTLGKFCTLNGGEMVTNVLRRVRSGESSQEILRILPLTVFSTFKYLVLGKTLLRTCLLVKQKTDSMATTDKKDQVGRI
jgi:hypothetical protein